MGALFRFRVLVLHMFLFGHVCALAQNWEQVWRKGSHDGLEITGLVLSAGSDTCISAGLDGSVKCWFVPDKRLLWSIRFGAPVSCLAAAEVASEISIGLFAGAGSPIRVISRRGEVIDSLSGPSGDIKSVSVAADGAITAAVDYGGDIWAWRGGETRAMKGVAASCIAIVDSGRAAISGHRNGNLVWWSTSTWTPIDTLQIDSGVESIASIPGTTSALAGTASGTVSRVSFRDTLALDYSVGWYDWETSGGAILSLAVDLSDRTALAGTSSGDLVRFYLADGRWVVRMPDQIGVGGVTALWAGGATAASGSRNGRILIWPSLYSRPSSLFELTEPPWSLSFRPDGQALAAAGWMGALEFDARTSRVRRGYGVNGRARAVAYSPDGREICVAGSDSSLRFYSAESGSLLASVLVGGWVTEVRYSRDGQYVAYRSYRACGIVERPGLTVREIEAYPDPRGITTVFAFDNSVSRLLVGRESGTLTAYSLDGRRLASRQVHSGVCSGIQALQDGTGWCSIGWDSTLRVSSLDLSESRPVHADDAPLNALATLGSGLVAVGTADGSVIAVDVTSGTAKQLARLDGPVISMAVNGTYEWLAFGIADELAVGRLHLTSTSPERALGPLGLTYRIAGNWLKITLPWEGPVNVVLADPLGRIWYSHAYHTPPRGELDIPLSTAGPLFVIITSSSHSTVLPLLLRR